VTTLASITDTVTPAVADHGVLGAFLLMGPGESAQRADQATHVVETWFWRRSHHRAAR
jgi:hypothetical protein